MNKLVLDLSQHNGNVNMTKVKNAGVYGIVQRVGYGTNTLDNTAYANMDNALANGLKVGAYWFVYATNVKEVIAESNNFINMIKRYDGKLELPLFIDFEYDTERYANQVGVQFTKQLRTDMIEAFCNNLEKQGYYAGIYANIDYLNNKFDSALINKYNLWVAHWNDKNNSVYANKAGLWQYTSTGKIDGISGNVDCNKMLIEYPTIIKKAGLNGFKKATPSTSNVVLTEAQKWLGTKQGDSNHKAIIDGYNSIEPLPIGYKVTYTDSWCDAFVSFVFKQVGSLALIGGGECGVERHIQIFKNLGIWIEDGTITPKVGDIITYNWDKATQPNDGFADHIGIVEKVSGTTITIIEGNINAKVGRRTITVGNGYIRGYARPKYSGAVVPTPTKKSNTKIADEVIAGKWGNGQTRIDRLKAAGYDPITIQQLVNTKLGIATKTNQQIADEVLAGKWGNGTDRKNKLTAAGYDYNAIQAIVNGKFTKPIAVGDMVTITANQYYTGQTIPPWVKSKKHEVSQISGDKVLLGSPNGICSWVAKSGVVK